MSRKENKRKFQKAIERLSSIASMTFWALMLFSFEEIELAVVTLLCAIIHELGHVIFIALMGQKFNLRGVANGFRIKSNHIRSYDEEIMIYLSGPIANIFCSILYLAYSILISSRFEILAVINLATGLSNLLPIKGYDGYGALYAIIKKRGEWETAQELLNAFSSALILSLCILSLYLIDRYDGGYWIFAVFFVSMVKEIKIALDKHF